MCPFKNHRLHCALFLTLSLVWLGTSTAEELAMASQDWPQWRGPNHDGVSSETGLLTKWPAEGPREVWRIQGGSGYSTVAVVSGRAFTLFASGDAEFAVCLDVTSGQQVWRTDLGELLVDNEGAGGSRRRQGGYEPYQQRKRGDLARRRHDSFWIQPLQATSDLVHEPRWDERAQRHQRQRLQR